MKFQQLIVLLPCHSLEDLSLKREPAEAEQLLAAWTVLFHPALLAATGDLPKWIRADTPPSTPTACLITLPRPSESHLPGDWMALADAAGAVVVRDARTRQEMLDLALGHLAEDAPPVDPALVEEFLALGYCYFQVELLTRQLRYMSNLDEIQFRQRTLAAAEEAAKGSVDVAREYLRSAFDLLTESREYFYPVEARLLDLTLVAPTTMGASLREELLRAVPVNLLISGRTVEIMAQREPETLAALKAALEKQTAAIAGGEFDEEELPLLPPEAILAQLRRGLAAYEQHLNCRPKVFGRRRFGLSPLLPQILKKTGFVGAFHFTLDDGRFPTGNQSKIRWEGLDGTAMEALARLPADATRADCFLRLAESLGHTLDLDHAATAVFAHWPGQRNTWYDALQRMGDYSPALGRFHSLDDYFRSTEYAGQASRHAADKYRSPYLRQEVSARQADPISRWVRYFRRRAQAEAQLNLQTLARLIGVSPPGDEPSASSVLLEEVERSRKDQTARSDLDVELTAGLEAAKASLAGALGGRGMSPRKGYLVLNPWSFVQRQMIDVSVLESLPAVGGAVVRTAESTEGKQAIVEVPAMGFAWLEAGAAPPLPAEPPKKKRAAKKEEPALAEENVLRNDFFHVALDPVTGAIKSIHDFAHRGNRLAQQLAFRSPQPSYDYYEGQMADLGDAETRYTIMAADEIKVASAGPLVGRIVTRGRLMDREGQRVARYTQTLSVHRGSRVLELEIELEPDREPDDDPWDSYFAARFAWSDATADLYRSVHTMSVATEAAQIEAPHFLDLRSESVRTTILTGGLPYHRRFGLRKLDTLLIVRGETARRFRLGIGIDLPFPAPAALGFLTPSLTVASNAPPPSPSGWLFHVNARNVIATAWEPVIVEGEAKGVRVRLLETEGRRTHTTLRCFRDVQAAKRLDAGMAEPVDLPVAGDQITVDLGAHEWMEVEAEL